jgi:hypothetical protein
MILNYLGIIAESGSNRQCCRRNLYNFRQFAVVKLVHIVADPFTTTEDICELFTVVGQKIFTQVSIKTRRSIFATLRVVLRTILSFLIGPEHFISPGTRHIATINQFRSKFFAIVVRLQDATQPFGITIIMMICRQNRTVSEFKTDAGASGDGRCLNSTNVL